MNVVKELIFEDEARQKLREGVVKLAEVAQVTLGPAGRHVGLEESWGVPLITSDGHSIVKNIEFKDQFQNMGASIAKEAAAKMKELCGDGTTTTMILLRACVEGGIKNIGAGASPIALKRGMEKALEDILEKLDEIAKPLEKKEDLLPIAISSASGNVEIGRWIASALQKVGPGGVVTIEEGKTIVTVLEMSGGMQFDRGYVSPYFCTNLDAQNVELNNAHVLITDHKINSIQEILPLLQTVAGTGRPLLIIADDIQSDALSTLVVNKLRGTLQVCVVKAPGFGEARSNMLQDIGTLTGSTVITDAVGLTLSRATADVLGSLQKAVITRDKTILVNETTDTSAIQERIKLIDAQLETEKNSHEREKLSKRKAQLSGGIAVIKVGGATEPEMKQKKQLFEDSLSSTQAAKESGIVPGGGVALLRASHNTKEQKLKGDERSGYQIVIEACKSPIKQIVMNAGLEPSLILEQVVAKEGSFGFNALTGQVEDLYSSGVIDAAKVVKSSLETAISSASIILLSEVLMGHAD